jgi:hypothetical protein
VAAAPSLAKALRSPVWRIDARARESWRMPPLSTLGQAPMKPLTRLTLLALRGYLAVAGGLVVLRIVELAARRL